MGNSINVFKLTLDYLVLMVAHWGACL